MSFNSTWANIVKYAGQTFTTVTGRDFTYYVSGGYVVPDRTDYKIPMSDFQKAWNIQMSSGLTGPGQINSIVRGPSYVYAILSDPRI